MEAGRRTSGRKTSDKISEAQERTLRTIQTGAAIVASASAVAETEGNDGQANVEVARPGITPKDLMLTVMRNAWEDADRKANEAEDLERQAAAIDREAADETLQLKELLAGIQRRLAIKLDATVQLRARASTLRLEVERDITLARSVAKDVAPYVHPELLSHSGEINLTITVINQ